MASIISINTIPDNAIGVNNLYNNTGLANNTIFANTLRLFVADGRFPSLFQNNSINGSKLTDLSISASKVSTQTLSGARGGSGQIALFTLTDQNLDSKAVTTRVLDDLSVTNTKINDVNAGKITAGTLAVARGGTGTTSLGSLRVNLGVVALSGDTMTGQLTVSNKENTINVFNGAIELREVNLVRNAQTTSDYAPAITFNWDTQAAAKLRMDSNGSFALQAQGTQANVFRTLSVATPTESSHAATKAYVDGKTPPPPDLSGYMKTDGTTVMTGDLVVQNAGPKLALNDSNNTYSGVLYNTGDSFYLLRRTRNGTTYSEETTTSAIVTIDMSGATAVGTMLLRGAFRATGNITAFFTSDEKLKENILTIKNPLEKIEQIKGVSFDWKQEEIDRSGGEDGYFVRKHDVGVIAQDIQKVLPEAVAERTDGVLGVNYDKIIPLLIEAIKELNGKVSYLESKLNN